MPSPLRTTGLLSALLLLMPALPAAADGLVDTLVRRFAESDFEFVRAQSNAPFPPLAWLTATNYAESRFRQSNGGDGAVTYGQTSVSQAALLPIPLGKRDAIGIGEWLSWTHFDLEGSARDELDVFSISLPVGWVRQATPDWQIAAFVAPLGHKTPQDSWYWETLGGVFGRNVRNARFAWIVGAYFDVSPLEDFYTPYLGAAYIIDDHWTLNAILPWPSVTYAPTPDTLFRLGVSPSGASWSIEPDERRPRMNLTSWNVGFAVERRVVASVWLGFEAGVAGLRGLSIVGSDWEAPETKLSNAGYALLTLNLRPGSPAGR
ncbi:MAG TPA: hypothetical protein PKE27_13015 [Povalibacter sp.]|uniref:hypothetical protein n=1 Tax=Povalibacter sp. TaxID=1962978 RepID=UPI002BC12A1C|nr:hypothetical protein [Povalibacter sp.]HMN45497.1 hypothetical protein [Povalibacter sp.]